MSSSGGSSGGGAPNAVKVRKFPFAYNTPNILTGAALYTPTLGDIVLDMWIEVDTEWDGTTPLGDIGSSLITTIGFYKSFLGQALPMGNGQSGDLQLGVGNSWGSLAHGAAASIPSTLYDSLYEVSGSSIALIASPVDAGNQLMPAKVISADPFEVWVTQDGTNTGASPGSTQGAAVLYIVTATPV